MKCSRTAFCRYVKDPKMTPKRKELLIYMLERIGREDGGKITIIFSTFFFFIIFFFIRTIPITITQIL